MKMEMGQWVGNQKFCRRIAGWGRGWGKAANKIRVIASGRGSSGEDVGRERGRERKDSLCLKKLGAID